MARHISWQAVVQAVATHEWEGRALTGITEDSREIRPGAVFVARRGRTWDGHDFAGAAAEAGAAFVVAERPTEVPIPVCLVPSATRALSRLAALWYGEPAQALRLVGVTGTNGKTTVAHLTRAILAAAGLEAFSVGTLGVWLGGQRVVAHLPWTTPPAPILHGHLAELRRRGATAGVLEVSAQALDQHRVDDCAFEVAAMTNVSREHGEYFADGEAYRAAKLRLFDPERPAGPPRWAVVNEALAQDPVWQRRWQALWDGRSARVLRYGWEAGDVRVEALTPYGLDGTDLVVAAERGRRVLRMSVHLALPGRHNVENALCAVAIGLAMQLGPLTVARGLESVAAVPGRLEHVQREPFRVIVDYAHNPAGLRSVLGAVRRATPGRLVLVIGARGGRDQGKRPLMGAVAAALCDRVVFTSDQPGAEDAEEAARPMLQAARDSGVRADFVASRWEALELAVGFLRPGDSLVVAGKGDEPWRGDGEPGPDTTDAQVLRALLGQRLARPESASAVETAVSPKLV